MQLAASLTAVFQTSFLEPSQRPAVPPRRGFDFYDRRGKPAPRIVLCSLRHITALYSGAMESCGPIDSIFLRVDTHPVA
jgi:hypothetical protein